MTESASQPLFVQANGIDIRYREAGSGPPLILLHGGSATNDQVWDRFGWGWNQFIGDFATDFRVLAPDLRGHGATCNPVGLVSYDLLADDLEAFIEALGLDGPSVIGFSDGGILAAVLTITRPEVVRAHVNIAGYDLFDPAAPTMELMRRRLSADDPEAQAPDLDYIEQQGGPWFDALIASHDGAQGPGTWRTLLTDAFDRWTAPIGYELDDLRRILTPTLLVAGDRDETCSPEESVRAFRLIPGSELAIVPKRRHMIAPEMVAIAKRFLAKQATTAA